jgi:preprotein translocase subunit SecA
MIQAKEGCEISARNETLARITYQRFFNRYMRLAGMSGTLTEVATELHAVYGLGVVKIPPNKPSRRSYLPERVFPTLAQKWDAVVASVQSRHATGQPILIGTRTVLDSEKLSNQLTAAGLAHRLLNARQDAHEAEIIATAGVCGSITVATNMAGRGTDIAPSSDACELGGLHVILTERHDASRIDRQLTGRCGRQGNPGSVEVLISLEDEIPTKQLPNILVKWLVKLGSEKTSLLTRYGAMLIKIAQKLTERRHARDRSNLLRTDNKLTDLLAFTGKSQS